jgi:hypothetical protein
VPASEHNHRPAANSLSRQQASTVVRRPAADLASRQPVSTITAPLPTCCCASEQAPLSDPPPTCCRASQ